MQTTIKPIPAFYCCYLLRSTVRHASLYVGSSPHPSRRLAQHNGKARGGAVRTSRQSLQPWEMACIVAGFPSNIAALQFEWAWQNAHLTRHILPENRISFPVLQTKINRKTGRTRQKPCRPRTSLVERLSNLHLLLRSTYFSQWPLELRFFTEDVHRAWLSWCGRVDTQVRPEIKIVLDLAVAPSGTEEFSSAQRPVKKKKVDLIGKGGIEGIDPTYASYQEHFEKGRFLLDNDEQHRCDICEVSIDVRKDLYSLCTASECASISHVTCLASRFLRDSNNTSIVPVSGTCPKCCTALEWSGLMRALSLRIRGQKEVQKLLKKKRVGKTAVPAGFSDDESDGDDDDDDGDEAVDTDPISLVDAPDADSSEDDVLSVMSVTSGGSIQTASKVSPSDASKQLEIVIDDSEEERVSLV